MHRTFSCEQARRGFTLIELLVVIAIIAILAAILFPVFAKAREKARQSSCMNNQRQIAVAMLMYAQDHDETLPDASNVWPEINVDRNILMCPTKGKKVANAYVYNNNCSSVALGELPDPSVIMLTADGNATSGLPGAFDNVAYSPKDLDFRHSNRLVASYADGHMGLGGGNRVQVETQSYAGYNYYNIKGVSGTPDSIPRIFMDSRTGSKGLFGPNTVDWANGNWWQWYTSCWLAIRINDTNWTNAMGTPTGETAIQGQNYATIQREYAVGTGGNMLVTIQVPYDEHAMYVTITFLGIEVKSAQVDSYAYPGGFDAAQVKEVSSASQTVISPAAAPWPTLPLAERDAYVFKATKTSTSPYNEGQLGLVKLPEEMATGSVTVSNYGVTTSLYYPTETKQIHLAFFAWDQPATKRADVLKAFQQSITKEMGILRGGPFLL
jgi:prepilin-type N-terminal cleavage/methylation domain-containing protein/prepilin-type processing-associated H-X9-DG protein